MRKPSYRRISPYGEDPTHEEETGPKVPGFLRWLNSFPMLAHYVAILYFGIVVGINIVIGTVLSDHMVISILCQLVLGIANGFLLIHIYQTTKIKKDNK